jgi:hypothetical protein
MDIVATGHGPASSATLPVAAGREPIDWSPGRARLPNGQYAKPAPSNDLDTLRYTWAAKFADLSDVAEIDANSDRLLGGVVGAAGLERGTV